MIAYKDGQASPDLVRLQAMQRGMTGRLFEYCDKHGLHIFLVCGSALGAMRHGNVIPWDDDVDVGMLRPDFERLHAIFEQEPLEGIYLQSHRNEVLYPYNFSKLRLDGTFVEEGGFPGVKNHSGIFVDIFPFDPLPRSRAVRAVQQVVLALFNRIIFGTIPSASGPVAAWVKGVSRTLKFVLRPPPMRAHMLRWREWTMQMPVAAKCDTYDSFGMYGIRQGPDTRIERDVLVPPVRMPFGEIEAWVPRDCETYLTRLFGDYRRWPDPEKQQPSHVIRIDFDTSSPPNADMIDQQPG
jgi:lipopolysaccharide cholinephosphotransferase